MKLAFNKKEIIVSIIIVLILFFITEWYVINNEKRETLSYAKESFKEAIDLDLQKRWERSIYYGQYSLYESDGSDIKYPITIHGESDIIGKFSYVISEEKDLQNVNPIRTEYDKRINQSILDEAAASDTIQVDTLLAVWNSLLKKRNIRQSTAIRIDCHLNSTPYTLMSSDTLTSHLSFYYIGSCFDKSVYSYIHTSCFSLFIQSLYGYNLFIVIAYISIILILIFSSFYAEKKIMKETEKRVDAEEQKRIMLEKEAMTNKVIYYFAENVQYNKNTHTLLFDGEKQILRIQLAALMTLFLEKENLELSDAEIIEKIWPDGSGSFDKRRRLICDFRRALPDKYFLIKQENQGSYKLHFIKQWDVAECDL